MKEPKYEHGSIENNSYVSLLGERIKFGDRISLTFLGAPNNFPKPWVLTSAEMRYSTVCYDYVVDAVITASNGEEIVLEDLRCYSPHAELE